MNSTHSDSPESQSTQPLDEPRKKINGLLMLAVLLAPAVMTSLLALFKIGDLTTYWVLTSSPVAGIISGIMLSRTSEGSLAARIFIALILMPVLTGVGLVTCFMGCGLAGGGGV